MLLRKDEIQNLKINVNTTKKIVEVYLNNLLIHTEQLYEITYEEKINKIKKILLFH